MSRIYKPKNVVLKSNTEIYTNQRLLIIGESSVEDDILEILKIDYSIGNEKTIVRLISGPTYDDPYFEDWSEEELEYLDTDGVYTVDIIIFHGFNTEEVEFIGFDF